MDMIVNSLYSNRDVFLRELISNASDALDKLRFVSVTDQAALAGREELEILVSADKDAGTVTIEDSGIGMTHEQLLSNLGTIARSGTRKFMEAVKDAKGDASLIGQFGVGFYSAFLVADRVSVLTKSHEDAQAWLWQSAAGSHQYTVKKDDGSAGAPLARGTRVVLHLKEDAAEMADPIRLARLIKQYSQFIQFPIKLYSATKEPKSVRVCLFYWELGLFWFVAVVCEEREYASRADDEEFHKLGFVLRKTFAVPALELSPFAGLESCCGRKPSLDV
jgi:heat shock protein beta